VLETIDLYNESLGAASGLSPRHIVDLAHALFAKSMQAVLRDSHFRKLSKITPRHMDMLKLAVETVAMHGVYDKIFAYLTAAVAEKDAEINKQARNLAQAQPEELGVSSSLAAGITPALALIEDLNAASTPLDKMSLLSSAVAKMMGDAGPNAGPISADELVPLLCLLVVRSENANWTANIKYMRNVSKRSGWSLCPLAPALCSTLATVASQPFSQHC
jgi:hypothetical protein